MMVTANGLHPHDDAAPGGPLKESVSAEGGTEPSRITSC